MYAIGLEQNQEPSVLEGTFLVSNSRASILFDTGASNSFISATFVTALGLIACKLDPPLSIQSALGSCVVLDKVCRECEIEIGNHHFVFDLIMMNMMIFDDILGIDWLTTFQVTINYSRRRIFLAAINQGAVNIVLPLRKNGRDDLLN